MNLGFYKEVKRLKWKYLFFTLLLIVGFILRILLSPYGTFEGDFRTFKAWAIGISKVGFSKFYGEYWCDYMPGYLYVLWLLDKMHSIFPTIPDKILFKLPANLSDLGISILILFALRNITSLKNAQLASLAYFFNPASLSNSTFWGQVDSFHALPILVSIVLGIRRHFVVSSIFATIAFMIKPQSIVIFPIIGFFVIRDIIRGKKEDRLALKTLITGVKILAASYAIIIFIALPFIWTELTNNTLIGVFKEPIFFIKERFYTAYYGYKYTSVNAFNFWGMIQGMWRSDQDTFLEITYQRWGTIIFGAFYALIFGFLFLSEVVRRGVAVVQKFEFLKTQNQFVSPVDDKFSIRTFYAVTLILFAIFLFVTRAHERHFLPTIVFFTLIAFRSFIYWVLYALISLVYVVNMFYAYNKYHTISGFSSSLIDPYVPVVVVLLVIIFLIVFSDFIRKTICFSRV